MQQSNAYIIAFAAGLTIVLGGLLSVTAVSLKERQKMEIELEKKKQILSAVMDIEGISKQELAGIYDERIKSIAVNYDGEIQTEIVPEDVNIEKEYKKKPEDRIYPVYKFINESNPDNFESVIIPVFGFGLWDFIWGYVALESDLSTMKGVSFDHRGETPGLGARITDAVVQERFKGKNIYNSSGELVSVKMLKSENNANLDENEVDGMSGATITANGVNDMLLKYLNSYQTYFEKLKAEKSISSL
ncbi:MAG: NADH:ubiquinone reductase (Na(+)-transporting) subunit C [Bacteroidota bacterium]